MTTAAQPVRVHRAVAAGAEEVLAAWLSADALAHWFRPLGPAVVGRTRVDATVGGRWQAEFPTAGGAAVVFDGTITELDRAGHLALDLRTSLPGAAQTSLRVRITPQRGTAGETDCVVELEHYGVDGSSHGEAAAAWRFSLGRIGGACPRALDSFYSHFDQTPGGDALHGGSWPDAPAAGDRLARRAAVGGWSNEERSQFEHWIANGYVLLPGAVDPALCDRLREDVEHRWQVGDQRIPIEVFDGEASFRRMEPQYRSLPHKILEYHAVSPLAREIQFAPAIRRFLERLFDRPAVPFQSLLFRYGTEQPMHQDTAYVHVRSPLEFAGCWVALEDIDEGTGELQYYVGSHRIPPYLWFDRSRAMPRGYGDDREFLDWVDARSRERGCPKQTFRPQKGDALVWHAELVHGGSIRRDRERTRWSLVTHYCPIDIDPVYSSLRAGPAPREHAPGCWYRFSDQVLES
jgi:uncharacterized protein YndB with AHSA1/START domain